MKRISSKATFVRKFLDILLGTFFLIASVGIWFSDSDDIVITTIGSVIFGLCALLLLWLGRSSCHVSLTPDGIHLQGFFKSDELKLSDIHNIIDLCFFYPHFVIIKSNKPTAFGKVLVLYPKRTGFLASRTPGLDALKRTIGK
ncbi:hypothetical protein [Tichowtungia aerotolerans]|uniref:Uncharacterized protein n=1 Tax=Tichowtungia aerotolerans TaxID=2697043 RepID=A0A6P1MCX0_9BACT|nr:hypothetical protein [Tichowtungia aerotolerans]QHI69446.1 hypothetical protein GT409_08260 [Tichowtungia aerotolerans]